MFIEKKGKECVKNFRPTILATLGSIVDTKNKLIYRHKNCVIVTQY